MNINPRNVLLILLQLFQHFQPMPPTNKNEKDLACIIKTIIEDHTNNIIFDAEEEDIVDFNGFSSESSDIPADDFEFKIEQEDSYSVDETESDFAKTHIINLDYKKEVVAFWKSGKTKKLSFDTVKNKYKKLKTVRQLYRWANDVDQRGNRLDKLRVISEKTLEDFLKARKYKIAVHDIDLQRWALRHAYDIQLTNFNAGQHWLYNFKVKNNIVSRKITKVISHPSRKLPDDLETRKQEFVKNVRNDIREYGAQHVFNSDQSSFHYEIHSGRTLEVEGEKSVHGAVQSIFSTTHSYTIQPTVSADGTLLSPFLLVLQEDKGEFGPVVKKSLFQAKNVRVMASKSGKLTKEHVKIWAREIFFLNTGIYSTLLLDSWRGHSYDIIEQQKPSPHKQFKLLTIPEGTTGELQPLDVYGFRMWKNFVRKFSDMVMIDNYEINLHDRNNIIKLHSLVHNQLRSPRFINLFQYAWYAAGYLDEKPAYSDSPVKFCFSSENKIKCDICGEPAFIKCAWCRKTLCFKHFFTDYHYCKKYVE